MPRIGPRRRPNAVVARRSPVAVSCPPAGREPLEPAPPPADGWRSPALDPPRARALALLERHGHHATSFQILERGNRYWFDGPADAPTAVVAYVEAAGHRVVAGEPVCARAQLAAVAGRFVADTAAAGLRTCFFSVERPFVDALAAAGLGHDALQIAEQPDFDPAAYTLDGRPRRSLRQQVARARNKGVRVRRIEPEDIARHPGSLRAQIDRVLDRWLASRRMSVMRFMVDLEPFTLPERRRYYIAERGDEPVGFLAAIPVYGRRGWFLEDVCRVPDAPNGTAELLIHRAMADARDRGDDYLTLGMAPLSGIDPGPGAHRRLRVFLRFCASNAGPLYDFRGVRRFKQRFRPDRWTPQYVVACPGPVRVRTFAAVLGAFADGGIPAFAMGTVGRLLSRVPAPWWARGLYALAAGLVPWTVLLALADGERWFGDRSIQAAWVVFDGCMVLALLGLGRLVSRARPVARRLAMLLAGATLTDVVLSTVQALHLHRAVGGWAALFVTAGIAGPLLATLYLWMIAVAAPGRSSRRGPP